VVINTLSVENFRAFRELKVSLSKINIFVGPNNSGKSSLISAVNLIAQNIRPGSSEFSLILNGPFADLGTFYDVVHNHSSKSKIKLAFEIGKNSYSYTFRYKSQKREIELTNVELSDGEISYSYTRESESTTQKVRIKNSQLEVPGLRRVRFRGLFMVNPIALPFYSIPNVPELVELSRRVRDFTFKAMRTLEQGFTAFDSVGAFRAAPERTYYYTGEAPANVGRFGENFAQMLASSAATRERSNSNVLKRAATWFKDAGVARDVRINPLTKRHFELLVEDDTGSKNNITDSGFGCSQVLPVLVAGYSLLKNRRASLPPTLVVQEPEIHLHPTAAAHLGTFFVDLARSGVQCFVETHSENIILRVARHVALGEITPDDVRIYWVSGSGGEHVATRLNLNADGTFDTEWPAGFFPTRASETLQLARAASGIPLIPASAV
jgi:predicted ATPase